jgi:hypothetical protein
VGRCTRRWRTNDVAGNARSPPARRRATTPSAVREARVSDITSPLWGEKREEVQAQLSRTVRPLYRYDCHTFKAPFERAVRA